jgi:integrase
MERPNPKSPRIQQPPIISWEEQLQDHNQKIEEYLQNRVFRGCTYESTVRSARAALKRLFDLVPIEDPKHPEGHRHIFVWEFLDSVRGSSRFGVLMSALLQNNLAHGTRRRYLTELRSFCDYVLAKPNIPGSSNLTIIEKYGPIALPFTKYDLPVHTQDRPTKPRYALSAEVRDEFYEFLRTEYLPNHPLPHLGAQGYTAIVLQAEIGARTSELLGIRSSGVSCDIDWQAVVRVSLAKQKQFSGKRVRTVPLTPFATEVLSVFEKIFKLMFPRHDAIEYLFLDQGGNPLMARQYFYIFRKIVELARDAGVPLPEDLRPHDLRRTCATLALEQNPLDYRKVLTGPHVSKLGRSLPYCS